MHSSSMRPRELSHPACHSLPTNGIAASVFITLHIRMCSRDKSTNLGSQKSYRTLELNSICTAGMRVSLPNLPT